MDPRGLFRKAALEKLASPERLDILVRVTSPLGWLALLTMMGVVGSVVAWGFLGEIKTRVEGGGLLLSGGGQIDLKADADGTLREFTLKEGDEVTEGEPIGRIDQPDYSAQVQASRQEWQRLVLEAEKVEADVAVEVANLRTMLRGEQERVQRLEELGQGAALNVLEQARAQVIGRENQIQAVEAKTRPPRLLVEKARADYEALRDRGARTETVVATASGTVLQVKKKAPEQVRVGEALATIQRGGAIRPVVYIASAQAQRVKAGMAAEVSPVNVKREEYGFVKATVRSTGTYPASPEGLENELKNQLLVGKITKNGTEAVIRVELDLCADPTTPSGLCWSSKNGPPHKVDVNTEFKAAIVVEARRPVELIVPLIRSALGAS